PGRWPGYDAGCSHLFRSHHRRGYISHQTCPVSLGQNLLMANAASIEPHEGPAIEFDAVRIGFEEGDILRSVSFRVMPQETVVLLGETGTGKTLSLKLAAGLLQPNAGSVHVLGKNLGTMTERELLDFRREIGFVFQEGALFDSMTVADNVAYRLLEDRA